MILNEEDLKRAIEEDFIPVEKDCDRQNNQYYINGSVLAIVYNGIKYVTPLTNKYNNDLMRQIQKLGFEEKQEVFVPYSLSMSTSPGFDGQYEVLRFKDRIAYMREKNRSLIDSSPSDVLIEYYMDLMKTPEWQKWDKLVKQHPTDYMIIAFPPPLSNFDANNPDDIYKFVVENLENLRSEIPQHSVFMEIYTVYCNRNEIDARYSTPTSKR